MKLTLMITGSPSALSKILAELDDDVAVSAAVPELRTDDDDEIQPTGELDSTGLPWDERIHASTRTQTAKGVWKKRKGVDEATTAAVENELRARDSLPVPLPVGIPVAPPVAAPMPVPAPAPAPIPTIPLLPQADAPMPAPATPAPAPIAPPVAAPTPVPMPVTAPAPVAQSESVDMMTLMTKIAAGQTAGTLDADYVNDLVKRVGTAFNQPINSVVDMMSKPDMLTYTAQLMQHDGKW